MIFTRSRIAPGMVYLQNPLDISTVTEREMQLLWHTVAVLTGPDRRHSMAGPRAHWQTDISGNTPHPCQKHLCTYKHWPSLKRPISEPFRADGGRRVTRQTASPAQNTIIQSRRRHTATTYNHTAHHTTPPLTQINLPLVRYPRDVMLQLHETKWNRSDWPSAQRLVRGGTGTDNAATHAHTAGALNSSIAETKTYKNETEGRHHDSPVGSTISTAARRSLQARRSPQRCQRQSDPSGGAHN